MNLCPYIEKFKESKARNVKVTRNAAIVTVVKIILSYKKIILLN